MTPPPAPLRFLMLVVGGWVGVRLLTFLPWAAGEPEAILASPARAEPAAGSPAPLLAELPRRVSDPPVRPPLVFAAFLRHQPESQSPADVPRPSLTASDHRGAIAAPAVPRSAIPAAPTFPLHLAASSPAATPVRQVPRATAAPRLAASAWLFIRDEGPATLAPGGALGGSQAGARLTYRLNDDRSRPLSVSARLYAPLDNVRGAEAALGIDWRPIAALPVHILAERRQAIGRDGRSDFALLVHGGGEARLARGRIRVEGFGQAGVVGAEEGDLFADGAVTITTRIGPVDVGAGAWGGAQLGTSRLDLGPHASFRLPVGRVSIRASAEWRFRVAGDAAPASGPALTISTGF